MSDANVLIAEILQLSRLLEGHGAKFRCAVRHMLANVENIAWYLNTVRLSNDINERIKIMTKDQPNDTLVLDPAHFSDSGRQPTSS